MANKADKYPEEAIAVSNKGKKEARIFIEKGTYTRYTYKDAETGKIVQEGKESVVLRGPEGNEEQLFMIPMSSGKSILIRKKDIQKKACYDEKTGKLVNI